MGFSLGDTAGTIDRFQIGDVGEYVTNFKHFKYLLYRRSLVSIYRRQKGSINREIRVPYTGE